jgi:hypothetical protein
MKSVKFSKGNDQIKPGISPKQEFEDLKFQRCIPATNENFDRSLSLSQSYILSVRARDGCVPKALRKKRARDTRRRPKDDMHSRSSDARGAISFIFPKCFDCIYSESP